MRIKDFKRWKPYLGWYKCTCIEDRAEKIKEEKIITHYRIMSGRQSTKQLPRRKSDLYPINTKQENSKFNITFNIKYDQTLSFAGKCLLNTFKNKYIYYAIDDILYSSNLPLKEQESLLTLLHSSMLFLHNNHSINFFDIWIDSIYFNNINKNNKFLTNDSKNNKPITYITIKLYYITKLPVKKAEPIW